MTAEIIRQYSLQGGATEFDPQMSELPPGESPSSTFTADRNAFLNPGGRNQHFSIALPEGVTAKAFREQVIQLGDSYLAVWVSVANQRSTWLSQDAEVGVKCA